MSVIRVGMFFIFTCSIVFSTATVVSLEQRFAKLEEKVFHLEEKVTQLQATNGQMETKVKEQEAILNSILIQTNQSTLKSILNKWETAIESSEMKERNFKDMPGTTRSWSDTSIRNAMDRPGRPRCRWRPNLRLLRHDIRLIQIKSLLKIKLFYFNSN